MERRMIINDIKANKLVSAATCIFIEKIGHTYQMKNQEVADLILSQIMKW